MDESMLKEFRYLQREVVLLREEQTALLTCLKASGAINHEMFLVRLHQQRFAIAQKKHPSECLESLETLLHRGGVSCIAAYAGVPSARSLLSTSRSTHQAINNVVAEAGGPREFFGRVKEFICLVGGHDEKRPLNSVEMYDPRFRIWQQLPQMTEPRIGHAAACLNGAVYVFGGSNEMTTPQLSPFSSAERWMPGYLQNSWESLPPMNERRIFASAGTVGHKIVVCGGSDGTAPLSSVTQFDPSKNVWETVASMPTARSNAATAVFNGRLFVCGGYGYRQHLNIVEVFDSATGTWESLPPMTHQRHSAAAGVLNGKLYSSKKG